MQISPGHRVAPFELDTLAHGRLRVPDPGGRVTHLSFRRFAGCPICNLHLRALATRIGDVEAAGIRTVALFHSSAERMRPYQGDLPFPVAPDPERRWYTAFGVETSALAILHPAASLAALRGMWSVPSNPLRGEGGHGGLPAEFLVDGDGIVRDLHYGDHPADAWSVDDLLARCAAGATVNPR